MSHYRLEDITLDEVAVIQSAPDSDAVWNLFWLANPLLDLVPGTGNRWYKVYRPTEHLLSNVIWSVGNDEALARKLLMNPLVFSEWFSRQEPFRFRMTEQQNENILTRSEAVGRSLLVNQPPVVIKDNVVHVRFGGMG